MAAVTSGAGDLDRIAAAVRFGGIEGYSAALVAVRSVSCPCRLVPSALEVVGDLSQREWEQGESSEAKRAEHDSGWNMGRLVEVPGSVCETLLIERGLPRIL